MNLSTGNGNNGGGNGRGNRGCNGCNKDKKKRNKPELQMLVPKQLTEQAQKVVNDKTAVYIVIFIKSSYVFLSILLSITISIFYMKWRIKTKE